MSTSAARPYLWSRAEYDRMVEAGVFHPETRVELVEGEILTMSPQGSRHITAIRLVEAGLRGVFTRGFDVRSQAPISLDDRSEPIPDVSVVTGLPRDYRDAHPTTAVLIVEVADSSLRFDRGRKRNLYARSDIEEYWVLNLQDARLEVWRHPRDGAYAESSELGAEDRITPLAQPDAEVAVADLVP